MVIRSFGNRATARLWDEQPIRSMDARVLRVALRKLEMLHAAREIEDLRVPPGNRLEQLKGDRRGQHSIWVNDQWRICCKWKDGGAEDVELVDYH